MKVTLNGSPMRGLCSGCRVDLDKLERDGFLGHVCDAALMTVEERIATGRLPASLEGGDWRCYTGPCKHANYDGFCLMWAAITWVRYQGFERDADAEWAAEDYC